MHSARSSSLVPASCWCSCFGLLQHTRKCCNFISFWAFGIDRQLSKNNSISLPQMRNDSDYWLFCDWSAPIISPTPPASQAASITMTYHALESTAQPGVLINQPMCMRPVCEARSRLFAFIRHTKYCLYLRMRMHLCVLSKRNTHSTHILPTVHQSWCQVRRPINS